MVKYCKAWVCFHAPILARLSKSDFVLPLWSLHACPSLWNLTLYSHSDPCRLAQVYEIWLYVNLPPRSYSFMSHFLWGRASLLETSLSRHKRHSFSLSEQNPSSKQWVSLRSNIKSMRWNSVDIQVIFCLKAMIVCGLWKLNIHHFNQRKYQGYYGWMLSWDPPRSKEEHSRDIEMGEVWLHPGVAK